MTTMSAGGEVSRRDEGRKAAAVRGHHFAYHARLASAAATSPYTSPAGAWGRFARRAPIWAFPTGRRAHRRAPHHRCLLPAAAGGRRHGIRGERVQTSPARSSLWSDSAPQRCTSQDQVGAKRCGHRPGKELVTTGEMVDRVKAAVDARSDPDFVIMARTTALAVEGCRRRSTGGSVRGSRRDAIFPEAMTELAMYRKFAAAVKAPVLAEHHRVRLHSPVSPSRSCARPTSRSRCTPFRPSRHEQGRRSTSTRRCAARGRRERHRRHADPHRTVRLPDYHSFEQKLDNLFAKEKRK